MGPKTRKRQINPQAKRAAILDVAETLFSKHGYEATSTNEIATRAGVAVGTVFRIFHDKAGILVELHRRMEQRFIDAMNEGWSETQVYADRFRPMFDRLLECAEQNLELMPLYGMTKELSHSQDYSPGDTIRSTIESHYSEGVRAGAFIDKDPVQVSFMMHGMVDGAMRYWMSRPSGERRRDTVDGLVEFSRMLFVQPAA